MVNKKNRFEMMMLRLPKLKGIKIKVEKTEDYYNLFSIILKVEDESIRNDRHYWVMALDSKGYVVCVYIFCVNPKDLMKISLKKIFRVALMFDAVDVVLAYNVRDDEPLIPSSENVAFFNKIFNLSNSILEIRVLDMMIISINGYHSDKEDGYLSFYTRDLSFKIVDDVKDRLNHLKKKYGRKKAFEAKEKGLVSGEKIGMTKGLKQGKVEGIDIGKIEGLEEGEKVGLEKGEYNKAVEMAKEMLNSNEDIKTIMKYTKLSEKEIKELEKDSD